MKACNNDFEKNTPLRSRTILKLSTRREKATATQSREMELMSDLDNLDIMIGSENINPIERELANTIRYQQPHLTLSPTLILGESLSSGMSL